MHTLIPQLLDLFLESCGGDMKRWGQIVKLLAVACFFLVINGVLYQLLTCRLGNNYSGAGQIKMVDVKAFLPFEDESDLARVDGSYKLTENLPVLDGAAALVPVYAAIIDNVYPEGCVTYEGGSFSDENYYGENFAVDSKMQYHNTLRGFNAMVDGTSDIFFGTAPSAEQLEYASEKGVELVQVPIGLEAFVFFVNKSNPVDNLTMDQIVEIYMGKYTNWNEVGGTNRPINPLTRVKGSGSQATMDKIMGQHKLGKKSPWAFFGGSLGFSFRYYLEGMVQNKNVKMLSLNGIYPNEENIQNGSYPIVVPFYAIYRKDNPNKNVAALTDWIISDEGQRLIEETGYVRIK